MILFYGLSFRKPYFYFRSFVGEAGVLSAKAMTRLQEKAKFHDRRKLKQFLSFNEKKLLEAVRNIVSCTHIIVTVLN